MKRFVNFTAYHGMARDYFFVSIVFRGGFYGIEWIAEENDIDIEIAFVTLVNKLIAAHIRQRDVDKG